LQAVGQTSPVQGHISEYGAKLADARAAGHDRDAALDLIILGYLYRQAGEMQKALTDLNQALPIEQATNNRAAQALAMSTMGRVYSDIGEEDRAIDLFQQAWAIWDQLGIKQAEALVLTSIGKSFNNRGEREKALTYLNRSLDIWNSLGDVGSSKRMLSTRQRMHDFGQLKALKELNDALPPEVREQIGRDGEASTLDSLGTDLFRDGPGNGSDGLL
jgi:tetratricopeptide (TPR) repeat protein